MTKYESEFERKRRASRNEPGEKGPHPDWQRNYEAAEYLIKETQGKLPEGMSLQLDDFKLTFSFTAPRISPVATPVSLHQDLVSFLPEMRAQLSFYKKGAEFYAEECLKRPETARKSINVTIGRWT